MYEINHDHYCKYLVEIAFDSRMESLNNSYLLIFAFLSGLIIQAQATSEYCPDPADIAPCQCTGYANYNIVIDCSLVTHEDELIRAFQADFPYTQMYILIIENNQQLREITSNILGLTTFQKIFFNNCELSLVASGFFENLKNSMTKLYINNCRLTDSGFDLTVLNELNIIETVQLVGNELETIPVLSSSTLYTFDLSNNSISAIADNAFTQATGINTVLLSGNNIQNIPNGTYQNTINY